MNMGTRGAYGFKKGNELKLTYNHFDSYFDWLGEHLISELYDVGNVKDLSETYDYIKLVTEKKPPTKKQINECSKFSNISVGNQSMTDWYCLLRNTQGTMKQWLDREIPYMINNNSFIEDTVFCEYYYIVDLDTEEFVAVDTFNNKEYRIPLDEIFNGNIKKVEDAA